jgi:hypothetical protein
MLKVIICHFEKNISWVSNLKHPFLIYNKNPSQNGKFDVDLPNVGFDTIAYLTYLIDNYHDLPDYVCFSQDDPFFHCPDFLNILNEFKFDKKFVPLGAVYFRDGEELNKTLQYCEENEIEYNLPIKFINSAQCIVSRELIKKKNLDHYVKIKNTLPNYEIINKVNYYVEYLWPTILGFNEDL